jgi:AsmA family protein
MAAARDESPVGKSRRRRWLGVSGLLVIAVLVLLWLVWDWNWFRPLVEARLSAVLGRPVTVERVELHPGRMTVLSLFGVTAGNPPGFLDEKSATIGRVTVDFDAETWLRTRRVVLPSVEIDRPNLDFEQDASGKSNWDLSGQASSAPPELGNLQISDGVAHVRMEKPRANASVNISTKGDTLVIGGNGTYAGQPVNLQATGGAILALRKASEPYPIDIQLNNGATRITLKGHIEDPLALKGADVNLVLSGPDMALLLPLTGIATPQTPPYNIAGRLDFENRRVRFTGINGRVGSSDLSGDIAVDPSGERPTLTANLLSHRVDMQDLGGFVGSTPGRTTTPGQTAGQVEEVKRAEASPKLLPTTPISIPKVLAADVHLTYRGEKILGKDVPFDAISAKLDIEAGRIRVSQLRLAIDRGALSGSVDLKPDGKEFDTDADLTAEHVDISRLLASAGLGSGRGVLDGTAKLRGKGSSMSSILAHGDGAIRAVMPMGGDINSLLVDLSGIEVGPALLAAIGLPNKEAIQCMVLDFALQQGILASRTMEIDTTDHVITGGGRIDLSREVVELTLRTDPKHFTIGKLATPISITGPFKHLQFAPNKELVIRGGIAAGLGVLFPPAAILPTIQFGVGEHSPCAEQRRP